MKRMTITLALVGASAIGLVNTSHAMTLPTPSALKEAVPSNTSQVFWRGGGWRAAEGGVQELALELRPVRSRRLPWPARLTGAADTGAVIPAMLMRRHMAMRRHMPMRRRPTPTDGLMDTHPLIPMGLITPTPMEPDT